MAEFYEGPTIFYAVTDRRTGHPEWIALWGTPEGVIYAWVANDKRWHRHSALYSDYADRDPLLTFTEITAEEASARILSWPPLAGWLADKLMAAPALTSAELGLPAA